MTPLLDLLYTLGTQSLSALWLPLAAWTLAAGIALALLHAWPPHPLVGYRVRQALLFALPAGLGLAAVTGWSLPLLPAAPASPVPLGVPGVTEGLPHAPGPTNAWRGLAWAHGLGLLTAGAVLLAAWQLTRLAVGAVRAARLCRRYAGNAEQAVQNVAKEEAKRLGVRRFLRSRVRLAQAPTGTPPMTLGIGRPTIVLPTGLRGEALRMALTHELIHLRRRDDQAAGAEALVTAIFAVHPLCALLRHQIDARREEAVDAAVLADGTFSARRYARLLYDTAASAPPSLALSLAAPARSLQARLHAMKNASSHAPRFTHALALALFALPLLLMACADLGAPQQEPISAEASPPQAEGEDAMSQWISSISVQKDSLEGNAIHVQVKPGTPPETRERLYEQVAGRAKVDHVTVTESPAGDGPSPKASRPALPLSVDERLTDHIQSINVKKAGAGHLRITLKPGTPAATANQLREQLHEQLPEGPETPTFTVGIASAASDASGEASESDVLSFADVQGKPRIEGGQQAIVEELRYPESARAQEIEGTVYVQFVVSPGGTATRVAVLRSPAEALSREAVRVIEALRFAPGTQDGRPVPVRMVQPVRFQL